MSNLHLVGVKGTHLSKHAEPAKVLFQMVLLPLQYGCASLPRYVPVLTIFFLNRLTKVNGASRCCSTVNEICTRRPLSVTRLCCGRASRLESHIFYTLPHRNSRETSAYVSAAHFILTST